MTVFEYLKAHPNTTSGEIAKGMNKKTPAVAGALSQLYTTGRIVKSRAQNGCSSCAYRMK
ncbi:FeoC-like transcriptional regulator [Citrobacter portucalensis]|uniref:FeoC-like transcriptional regulator n=1 Tax=Citrobacter portucalensis TaxID=1639133 RepID=UPI00374E1A23